VIQETGELVVGKQVLAMLVAEPVEKRFIVRPESTIYASPGRAGFFLYK
jgi:hypothetical protein